MDNIINGLVIAIVVLAFILFIIAMDMIVLGFRMIKLSKDGYNIDRKHKRFMVTFGLDITVLVIMVILSIILLYIICHV